MGHNRDFAVIDSFLLPTQISGIRKEVTKLYEDGRLKDVGGVINRRKGGAAGV